MLARSPGALCGAGFAGYALLTTQRALGDDRFALGADAAVVAHVPAGSVPDAAAAVRGAVAGRNLVALGGGRVVDAAKAVAAVDGGRVAAVPTTLAGSSFTPFHRMPAGVEGYGTTRPTLALCDPKRDGLAGDAGAGRHGDERARSCDRVPVRPRGKPGR